MARPKKDIDEKKVKQLIGFGLTVEEMAAFLECDKRTLERRFAADIKQGRFKLSASLKRQQVMVALKGNVGMLIWLGKQYLGQREKVEHQYAEETLKRLVIPDVDARSTPDAAG